jgi:prepilin-type N-terminal cleavage/methylation domain-containing protein
MPNASTARRRAGFTLPEMLITLLLLSIVGTALIRTMTKQQQAYKDTTRGATMRRELRLSGLLMTQDLRSISSAGGDVQEMTEQRVGFNGTFGSSIICARPAADVIDIPPVGLARHDLTSWTTTPKNGDTIYVYNDSLSAGSEDDVWQKLVIASIAKETASCIGPPYTDIALDPPGVKPRYRITVAYPFPSTQIGDSVKVGAVIRFTRPMRYELYSAPSGKWYLGYSELGMAGAWTAPEAVAGPFRAFAPGDVNPTGLQFRYYDSTGTRLTTSTVADRQKLSRIDVYTRAEGGASAITERKGAQMTDSTLYRIGLRNFK